MIASLTPYFATEPLASALADYHAGHNVAAAAAFEAFVAAHPDDPRARPARFLALLSRHDAGEHTPVASTLAAMAGQWPILADYAHLYAGSAHRRAGRLEAALSELGQVPPSSTLWPRAQTLIAQSQEAAGHRAAAIAALEAVVAAGRSLRMSGWALLSTLRREAGDAAGARRAQVELATRFAKQPAGRQALDAVVQTAPLDAAERFALGRALYRAKRHRRALDLLAGIAADDPHYCEARYLMARTDDRLKRRAAAWAEFQRALECQGAVRGDATFAAGRNRLRAGELDKAEELLTAHITEFPERTTVDDARLDLARILRERGDDEAADTMLLETLDEHPDGDQRDEVAWRLVWPRIEAGRTDDALTMVDEVLARVPRERHYRAEGRLRYWRGVLLSRAGRPDEASAQWRQVLEEHPLSWYAVLAYSRLAAVDPQAAAKRLDEVVAASQAPADGPARIPAALWGDEHLRKGVELARLGLAKSARRELRAAPRPRGEARIDWLWTQVALYQLAGAWHYGQRLARTQEPALGRYWPRAGHARRWRLAHPRPFAEEVARWATARQIDPNWLWSVMREESNFNPRVESWANAVGLMQIILPTAEFLAKGTDIEPTRANLQRPAVAIELGSKYLASLLAEHGSYPLASAGYNAGGGAVRRWRRAFGDVELDEFVERITYREARGYAKRVTRSLARYRWLYEHEMLVLPLAPPGPPG